MKVQLVVVQGKPEGALIPIALPKFKIGRGEGCQLRPSSDQISREHAEFEVTADSVLLRDLGSRNGTEVNGKKLDPKIDCVLKAGDLIKVGLLTFAISIEGGPAAKTTIAPPGGSNRKLKSIDDVGGEEIDSWLVSDEAHAVPDRASGVYGGDTMTMETYKEKARPASSASIPARPPSSASIPTKPASAAPIPTKPATLPAAAAAAPVPVAEPDVEEEVEENTEGRFLEDDQAGEDMGFDDLAAIQAAEAEAEAEEEFVDESNPFYVAKKQAAAATSPAADKSKDPNKDSSDLAHDILRKMMERRRASKS